MGGELIWTNRSSDTAESGIAKCARETATHSFKRRSDPTTGCRVMEFYIPMISRRGTAVRVAICGSEGSHSKRILNT